MGLDMARRVDLDNLNDTNEGEIEDVEEEGEDADGEDGEGEDADDEDEPKEEEKVEAPKGFEREEPPCPQPVNKQQAFNYAYETAIAACLKNSGFENNGAGDARIKGYIDKLSNTDLQELKAYASREANNYANEYEKKNIIPYMQWHQKERIKSSAFFVAREFPDIKDYKPEMEEIEVAFFKRNPELVAEPEISIPLLLLKAMELRLKRKGKLPSKAKERRSPPQMEVSGGRTSKRVGNERQSDFKVERPLKALDGILGR